MSEGENDLLSVSQAASDARKIQRLKQMQRIATCLLAVMVAVLLACVAWQAQHPWLGWVRAFAEAGTVGAVADWYAVVALFRRPFGLPIAHTAIIAENQARIAESLGSFVETNFLTPELIIGRLIEHNAAGALGVWLAEPVNSRAVGDVVADSLPRLFDGIDEADAARFFEHVAAPQLRTLDVSRAASEILKVLTEGDHHQPLLERGLAGFEAWLSTNVDLIKAKFSEASKYTPAPFDAWIVRKFVDGIVALLHEVAARPDHELRYQFDKAVQDLALQLRTSAVYRRFGHRLTRECIRYFQREGYAYRLLVAARERVNADINGKESVVRGMVAAVLTALAGC